MLISSVALNLTAFGFSAGRFPAAPAQLTLHFNTAGLADRFGEKSQLFVPPLLGLVTLAIGIGAGLWLYRRGERLAAFMVWGGCAVTQLFFGIAAVTLGLTLPS